MTSFRRSGHYRTNSHGTTFWVRGHAVDRDGWGRGQPSIDLRPNDASRLLERYSVRTISGCFVNPNAHCPVCSAAVYFYANEFGSRVYFDGLGPPWPKHPCTDNPRPQTSTREGSYGAPTVRTKGIMQELLTAANAAGISRGKVAGVRALGEWTLLTDTSIERRGEKNTVKAEFLNSLSHEVSEFKCFSSVPIFEVGDFVSKRGNEVSFLYKPALTPIVFVVDGVVSLPRKEDTDRPPPRENKSARSVSAPRPQATKKRTEPPPQTKTGRGSKYEISRAEMKHFQSGAASIDQFCAKLAPVIKAFAHEGTRKPRDVALRLNFSRYKTACGDQLTPRLACLLLGFIFNDKRIAEQSRPASKTRDDNSSSIAITQNGRSDGRRGNAQNSRQPLTAEEVARRRAVLERVRGHQESK